MFLICIYKFMHGTCLLKDTTSNTLVFTANLSDIGVGTYWPNAVESCAHTIDLEIFVAKIYLEFA